MNTWEYVSHAFNITDKRLGDIIRKISTSKVDKYNHLEPLREFLGINKDVKLSNEDIDNIIRNKGLFIKIAVISYLQNMMQHKGGKVNYYQFEADINKKEVQPDYSVKVIPFYTIADEVSKNMKQLLDIDNFSDNARIVISSLATEFSAQLFAEMTPKKKAPNKIKQNGFIFKVQTNYRIDTDYISNKSGDNTNFFNGKDEVGSSKEKHAYMAIDESVLDSAIKVELNALFDQDIKRDKLSVSPYAIKGTNDVLNDYNNNAFTLNANTKEAIDVKLKDIKIREATEEEYNDAINLEYSDKLDKNKRIERNSYMPIITNNHKYYFYVENMRDFIDPELLVTYYLSDNYRENNSTAKEEGGVNGKLQSYLGDLKDLIHLKLGLEGKLGDSTEVPFLLNKFYKIHKENVRYFLYAWSDKQ